MHTALCAFDNRGRAERARDSLLQAGFASHDVHIEHRHAPAESSGATDDQRDAADRGVLSSFGHFFASLLGRDNPSGHADTYSQHVERGAFVVVVDADDSAQAQRARDVLQGLQAGELNVVERRGQEPLREIVSRRRDPELEHAPGLRYADQD
ncbi:MAG: hypothetical protein K0R89_2931 [Ramlibacter sp.]|jgi:predicted metal-dependent phosphoesterase TrpH|nr:hypothetical protein [Ramlibacter sp.]